MRNDQHEGCTVHVGGVTGFLEKEPLLHDFCEDHFGTVLAATVRIRNHVPGKTSWAMVTFSTKECAEQMIMILGPDIVLDPKYPGNEHDTLHTLKEKQRLQNYYKAERSEIVGENPEEGAAIIGIGPVRRVDRLQVWGSSGSMGKVFAKHQLQVQKQLLFLKRRVKPSRERYADAVLASRLKRGYQEPGYLVVLKDELLQHNPNHRGWDVRVRPKDRMFDLMRKIRERVDGMADAEGIVRNDTEVQLGRKRRIRTVRQMKHSRTYLIRRRSAALGTVEALEIAMRFEQDDPNFKWVHKKTSKHQLVVTMQRIYRQKTDRQQKYEQQLHMVRARAAMVLQRSWRKWMTRQICSALHTFKTPRFRTLEMTFTGAVEARATKSTSKWGKVRSQLAETDRIKQQLGKRSAIADENARKQRLARGHWDDLRQQDAFRTVVMRKTLDGDFAGAFRHVRTAQAALNARYELQWKKTAVLAQDRANAAAVEAARVHQELALTQRRWQGARNRVVTIEAATKDAKTRNVRGGSVSSSADDVRFMNSAAKAAYMYGRARQQRARAACLAKPACRVCPPPRPAPMSTANYIVSGGEDCSWNEPVAPVPTPTGSKEKALLMSGGSPSSSPSLRQQRARLSTKRLLARRGYLTPRDLARIEAMHGFGTPGSPSRTARPSSAVLGAVAGETPGMEKAPQSARPASAPGR
eukprot:COSAG02_NODE_53_length_44062_cov_22.860223_21_plen_695_part_00